MKQYFLWYFLFREGVPVDPKPRLVTCYDFTVIEFAPPKLTFELSCSKGFYVRSLVHDLGIGECMIDFD
jgi:tRNA pseudouridine55 synthase